MPGDDPYQPPVTIEGPDENQALSSDFWTGKKILLLFLTPSMSAVALGLLFFIFPGIFRFGVLIIIVPLIVALGTNVKLSSICAKYNEYTSIRGKVFATTIWFIVWALAQILFTFFSLYMIGLILSAF